MTRPWKCMAMRTFIRHHTCHKCGPAVFPVQCARCSMCGNATLHRGQAPLILPLALPPRSRPPRCSGGTHHMQCQKFADDEAACVCCARFAHVQAWALYALRGHALSRVISCVEGLMSLTQRRCWPTSRYHCNGCPGTAQAAALDPIIRLSAGSELVGKCSGSAAIRDLLHSFIIPSMNMR